MSPLKLRMHKNMLEKNARNHAVPLSSNSNGLLENVWPEITKILKNVSKINLRELTASEVVITAIISSVLATIIPINKHQ